MNDTVYYFGLNAWVASPPLSVIISLLLLSGIELTGFKFLNLIGLLKSSSGRIYRMHSIPVGAMIFALALYPLSLFQLTPVSLFRYVGAFLVVLGIFNLVGLSRLLPAMNGLQQGFPAWSWIKENVLAVAILFALFLIAIGPVTNADSLDYHIGVAIAILNHGGMPFIPEWFTSRLAGNGEVLNALGLAIGAEQFGSLIQWGSLISIAAIFWPHQGDSDERKSLKNVFLLASIASPVIIFLISAPKPQLWPIALTTLSFYIFSDHAIKNSSQKQIDKSFFLVTLMCMSAAQAKFNYLLGGGLAGLLAFIVMISRKRTLYAVIVAAACMLVIMLPSAIWKSIVTGASIVDSFLSPLPGGLPGTEAALEDWSVASDFTSKFPFPISIIFPDSFEALSVILGVGWIVCIYTKWEKSSQYILALSALLLLLVVNLIAAPASARVFLEPYYWAMVLCFRSHNLELGKSFNYIRLLIKAQAFGFLLISCMGVALLFPGAIYEDWRETILNRSANGYQIMQWIDQQLPENAVLLNSHRSMALAPRDAVAYTQWTKHTDFSDPGINYYLNILIDKKPTHILLIGDISPELPLSGCFGDVFAGPGSGRLAVRNPMNRGADYEAWLVEFEWERLPDCAADN